MKEILEKILVQLTKQTEAIKFQTKVFEDTFHKADKNRVNATQMNQQLKASMDLFEQQMESNPAIKANPEIQNLIKNMLNIIPKGGP